MNTKACRHRKAALRFSLGIRLSWPLIVGIGLIVWLLSAVPTCGQTAGGSFERWGIISTNTNPELEQLLSEAYVLLYHHDYTEAENHYRRALALDSNCVEAYAGLSFVFRYMSDDTRAFRACREALRLDSTALPALWNYGELVWPWRGTELGLIDSPVERVRTSLVYLGRAAGINHPASAHANMSMGIAWLSMQDIEKAREQYHILAEKRYYPEVALDFARNILGSAEPNAIIFAGGDVDFMAPLCLQMVDSLRPDVSIVGISILGYPELAKCFRDFLGVPITLSDYELAQLQPEYDQQQEKVIYPQAVIARNIVENAQAQGRPVYFSIFVSENDYQEYADYLTMEGLLYRMDGSATRVPVDFARMLDNMTNKYRLPDQPQRVAWKSNLSPITNNAERFYEYYALLYVVLARNYLENRQDLAAAEFFDKAFAIYDFTNNRAAIEELVTAWLEAWPEDNEAYRLKAKYLDRL
jgi:hypothetical protein